MASAVIHIAVANEINKKIKKDYNKLIIGSIAPDLSKHMGKSKLESHFLDDVNIDIPNIDKFLEKYKEYLNDDFVLGYFIHLYTDYLWAKYFIPEIYENDMIKKIDGTVLKCTDRMLCLYIYNDYTNLNESLIKKYDLNIESLNSDIKVDNIIKEIPMENINIIINATKEIAKKTKIYKDLVINMEQVKNFIELSTKLILSKLEEIVK